MQTVGYCVSRHLEGRNIEKAPDPVEREAAESPAGQGRGRRKEPVGHKLPLKSRESWRTEVKSDGSFYARKMAVNDLNINLKSCLFHFFFTLCE